MTFGLRSRLDVGLAVVFRFWTQCATVKSWNAQMKDIKNLLNRALQEAIKEQRIDPDELDKILPSMIETTLPALAETLLKSLWKRTPEMLKERRRDLQKFGNRLFKRYRKAFDLLDMFVVICEETGSNFNTEHRNNAVKNRDYKFMALTAIHARALLVTQEIVCLLKGEFADGALGKWRTLHELSVTALFLAKADQEISHRYLEHFRVHSYKAIEQYQEHHKRAALRSFSEKEVEASRNQFKEAIASFGKEFKEGFGWAYPVLKKGRINFFDLEKYVELDYWRPRYR